MREFVFTIEHRPGVSALTDVFIDHPELIAETITITISKSGMWRVDRVSGSETALQAFKDAYTDPVYCIECGGDERECTSEWTFEILSETQDSMTIYSYLERLPAYCHSIPHLATLEFGDGLVFDAQRRQHIYEWRILLPDGPPIGPLFDRLNDGVGDEVQITLRQVTSPTRWDDRITTIADLPHEQRQALEAAVGAGYYATPRSIDLATLSDELEVPKSTLRYRLRRAEAWLIESFVSEHSLLDYSTEEAVTHRVEDAPR